MTTGEMAFFKFLDIYHYLGDSIRATKDLPQLNLRLTIDQAFICS